MDLKRSDGLFSDRQNLNIKSTITNLIAQFTITVWN